MYVLMREGVYQQGVYGVFDDEQVAVDSGVEAIKIEHDDYHEYSVYRIEPNKLLSDRDGRQIVRISKKNKEVKFQWFSDCRQE